jgi:hypothetical protein
MVSLRIPETLAQFDPADRIGLYACAALLTQQNDMLMAGPQ